MKHDPVWIDEAACVDFAEIVKKMPKLPKSKYAPIVYVEPTPEEAEALRLEYELFKKRTIDLPTPADK